MDNSFGLPRISTMTAPLVGSMYAKTRSYLAFVWLGLGSLLPFYFFTTADPYYRCKLHDNSTVNSTTDLDIYYANTVTFCSTLVNLLTIILVTFVCVPYIYRKRIYISLTGIIVCLIASLVIAIPNYSSSLLILLFCLIMIFVMILNVFSAILLNCYFSLASTLPSRYIQGFGVGQALAGLFVALCFIISMAITHDLLTSLIIYFLLAILVLASNIVVYFHLEKTHLFQIYSSSAQEINNEFEPFLAESSTGSDDNQTLSIATNVKRQRFLSTLKQIKWHFSGVICSTIVTYALFPGYLSKIQSNNAVNDDWSKKYFVPIMTFLFYFLGDTIGRIVTIKLRRPSINSPRLLFFICLFRIVFIFLFSLFKHKGQSNPIIPYDYIYGLFVLIFSFSHGYCSTLSFMYAPLRVQTQMTSTAGALMTMALAIGAFIGSSLSYLVVFLNHAYISSSIHCSTK